MGKKKVFVKFHFAQSFKRTKNFTNKLLQNDNPCIANYIKVKELQTFFVTDKRQEPVNKRIVAKYLSNVNIPILLLKHSQE